LENLQLKTQRPDIRNENPESEVQSIEGKSQNYTKEDINFQFHQAEVASRSL